MSKRSLHLMSEAAQTFEDQASPFCTDWLVKHDVTADECFELSKMIALAIEYYLAMRVATGPGIAKEAPDGHK